MNKWLGTKFKILSALLTIAVVLIHSHNLIELVHYQQTSTDFLIVKFIQDLISNGIARIAVPIYFLLAGYLFFVNLDGKIDEFIVKIKKRIRSLFIPYIIWCTLGVLVLTALHYLPFFNTFFTENLLSHISVKDFVNFYIYPVPYQLWFIRDLMVLVLLSPVIFILLKYVKFPFLLILLVAWVLEYEVVKVRIEAIFYFSLGAYLVAFKEQLQIIPVDRKFPIISMTLWIVLLSMKMIVGHLIGEKELIVLLLSKTAIVAGIWATWTVYDYFVIDKDMVPLLESKLTIYSFFLYEWHEPVLLILKKVLFGIFGRTPITALVFYFVVPVIAIAAGVAVAVFLSKYLSKAYAVLTGGR